MQKHRQSDLIGILGKGSGVKFPSEEFRYDDRTADALCEVDLLESFLSGYVSRPRDERSEEAATFVNRQFDLARKCIGQSPEGETARRLADYVTALEDAYQGDR